MLIHFVLNCTRLQILFYFIEFKKVSAESHKMLNCHYLIFYVLAIKCKSTEFHCKTKFGTYECLPASWQCDGSPDCLDGSDEPINCCMLIVIFFFLWHK